MGKRVLLAEDSLTIQKVFELTFRGSDIALTMVDNGEDAIRLAGEIAPDLVIADVSLPGKSGFEVAAALSVSGRPKALPVLILSGTLAPFDEEKFRKSGAAGVLFKPFESQELFEKIETILKGGETARAAAEPKAEPKRPAAEETWDFTDVIEEAEREAAKAEEKRRPAGAPAPRGAEILAGLTSPVSAGEGAASLGDFDVSLEDLEGPSREVLAGPAAPIAEVVGSFDEAVDEGAPPVEAGAAKPPPHITGELFQDAPPAVTDLTAALDSIEEFADLEVKDEMTLLEEEVAARAKAPAPAAPQAPASPQPPEMKRPASFSAMNAESRAQEAPPRRPSIEPPPVVPPRKPQAEPRVGAAAATAAAPGAAPDEFSARTREVFEKVAADAVEKAMWDVMERLSGEFSAKVREAVEAVAWEVIPPTAEALIREEIARIRGQAEKKSS
ncbi:MAG: response regulator [Deltaproteobacteria bacterium]